MNVFQLIQVQIWLPVHEKLKQNLHINYSVYEGFPPLQYLALYVKAFSTFKKASYSD